MLAVTFTWVNKQCFYYYLYQWFLKINKSPYISFKISLAKEKNTYRKIDPPVGVLIILPHDGDESLTSSATLLSTASGRLLRT